MNGINLNQKTKVKQSKSLVTILNESVRFNQYFILELKKQMKITNKSCELYVKIEVFPDDFVIQFTFSVVNELNGIRLNKLNSTNVVRIRPLFQQLWVKKSYENKVNSNQWELKKVQANIWKCSLYPIASLKIQKSDICNLDDNLKGFYELYDNDDTLIYIGISKSSKGIKSRLMDHLKDKDFEYIKYAEVSDLSKLRDYERTLLNNYKNKYGRLPYYNKQG